MYELIESKKSQVKRECDFEFKDFRSFYNVSSTMTVPLIGRYKVNIMSDNVEEITEFIKREQEFNSILVNIYTSKAAIEYISMYKSDVQLAAQVSVFDQFKELIKQKSILIDKRAMSTLYASIEHSYDEMEKALNLLVSEYGAQTYITEKMLSELFILNKVVYPRQVLDSYLKMDRWRQVKLSKCLDSMSSSIIVNATAKNLKALVEDKAVYFKTGKCKESLKYINTNRLLLLYRIFVLERCGIKDITLLYELYERGLSPNDIIQGEDGWD